MAEEATRLPVKTEESKPGHPTAAAERRPFDGLKREIDHLFEDFGISSWRVPFTRSTLEAAPSWRELSWSKAPAVDIVDRSSALEVTAELPGMDVNDIEVKFADGMLTIRGEKIEVREENKKDHYLSERRYGSFSRSFRIPNVIDADRIEASFNNGVLTVTLPKSPEAQKSEKKIAIRQS
jgi:HSP20 family protein